MILKVERKSIYDDATVTEPNGTVRIIRPLYFGQMIWQDSGGNYRYDRRVPKDYWKKHGFLISRGWTPHWHYDGDWQKGSYNEYSGTTTESALKVEKYYE